MALPSVADAAILVVLLCPGFIAFFLARRISAVEQKFSDLEITVWSLFLSLIIYVPFGTLIGLTDIDTIRNIIFLPSAFVALIILTVLIGAFTGVALKFVRGPGISLGTCWDVVGKEIFKKAGGWVIVYTDNGLEYKGVLHLMDFAEARKHEIVVGNPKLILRDEKWNVLDEVEMGKEILFTEKDVRRVVFFDEIE